jgi:hypothetical protein
LQNAALQDRLLRLESLVQAQMQTAADWRDKNLVERTVAIRQSGESAVAKSEQVPAPQ